MIIKKKRSKIKVFILIFSLIAVSSVLCDIILKPSLQTAQYEEASQLVDKSTLESLQEAVELYERIGEKGQLIKQAKYQYALKARYSFTVDTYSKAMQYLSEIEGYEDSAELLKEYEEGQKWHGVWIVADTTSHYKSVGDMEHINYFDSDKVDENTLSVTVDSYDKIIYEIMPNGVLFEIQYENDAIKYTTELIRGRQNC